MCGIAGIYAYTNSAQVVDISTLSSMGDLLRHRGPDDFGIWHNGNVGCLHYRLSIIDPASGQQPMISPATGNVICLNGEIFNYIDLKKDLTKKGVVFRTRSDTEVLLRAYDVYGIECLNFIDGQFSFSIWDEKSQTLLVARDRFGITPFYYTVQNNVFFWASEIKAFFALTNIRARLNRNALHEYFCFRHVAGENTLFDNIFELLPGHYMSVSRDGLNRKKYWDIAESENDVTASQLSLKKKLYGMLEQSVKNQMISDFPVGTMNSGGLDSSIISMLAKRSNPEHQLNTYSASVTGDQYNESYYSNKLAAFVGSKHQDVLIRKNDYSELLGSLIYANDEPLHLYNAVPMAIVAKHARRNVKVILTGEGADEVFGGYGRYWQYSQFFSNQGASRNRQSDHSGRHKQIIQEIETGGVNHSLIMSSAFWAKDLYDQFIVTPSRRLAYREMLLDQFTSTSNVQRMLYYDQKAYLTALLQRQDRMLMSESLEGRLPFLDHKLVNFVNTEISMIQKVGKIEKNILRDSFQHTLPAEITNRKKFGFAIPSTYWMDNREFVNSIILEASTNRNRFPFVIPDAIDRWLKHFSEDRLTDRDHNRFTDFVFSLVNLVLWANKFDVSSG